MPAGFFWGGRYLVHGRRCLREILLWATAERQRVALSPRPVSKAFPFSQELVHPPGRGAAAELQYIIAAPARFFSRSAFEPKPCERGA